MTARTLKTETYEKSWLILCIILLFIMIFSDAINLVTLMDNLTILLMNIKFDMKTFYY